MPADWAHGAQDSCWGPVRGNGEERHDRKQVQELSWRRKFPHSTNFSISGGSWHFLQVKLRIVQRKVRRGETNARSKVCAHFAVICFLSSKITLNVVLQNLRNRGLQRVMARCHGAHRYDLALVLVRSHGTVPGQNQDPLSSPCPTKDIPTDQMRCQDRPFPIHTL